MTTANVFAVSAFGLPQALKTAQQAIHLPEVQEMLRKLSDYKLGIFMPHMHEDRTGEFRPLADDVIQVESGLNVSFQSTENIAGQTDRFLPVGWVWRDGASAASSVCEMVQDPKSDDSGNCAKHTMPERN